MATAAPARRDHAGRLSAASALITRAGEGASVEQGSRPSREGAAPRPSSSGRLEPGPGHARNGGAQLFSAGLRPLQREAKELGSAVLRSAPAPGPPRGVSAAGGPSCGVPARPAPGFSVATKAAAVAVFPNREPTMFNETVSLPAIETNDASGASAPTHPLDELVLYAHRPFQDDSDPRPLPDPEEADTAIFGAMNAIADLLTGTRLEDDLPDLLWSFANVFHRQADRIGRQLDDNEQQQRRSQSEQDGTEVKSVELERL